MQPLKPSFRRAARAMFDMFGAWRRLAAAGTTMQATGERGVTMMGGASDVIAARGAIIGEAVLSPWTADQRELGRTLPEKMMAMSHAGSAAASVLWDSHALWMNHMQHLGAWRCAGGFLRRWRWSISANATRP